VRRHGARCHVPELLFWALRKACVINAKKSPRVLWVGAVTAMLSGAQIRSSFASKNENRAPAPANAQAHVLGLGVCSHLGLDLPLHGLARRFGLRFVE
jgi:hypothetical protein